MCPYEPESEMQTMEWRDTDSSVKKRFRVQRSVKKLMLAVFWSMKESIAVDFLENTLGKVPFIYWITLVYFKIEPTKW